MYINHLSICPEEVSSNARATKIFHCTRKCRGNSCTLLMCSILPDVVLKDYLFAHVEK